MIKVPRCTSIYDINIDILSDPVDLVIVNDVLVELVQPNQLVIQGAHHLGERVIEKNPKNVLSRQTNSRIAALL